MRNPGSLGRTLFRISRAGRGLGGRVPWRTRVALSGDFSITCRSGWISALGSSGGCVMDTEIFDRCGVIRLRRSTGAKSRSGEGTVGVGLLFVWLGPGTDPGRTTNMIPRRATALPHRRRTADRYHHQRRIRRISDITSCAKRIGEAEAVIVTTIATGSICELMMMIMIAFETIYETTTTTKSTIEGIVGHREAPSQNLNTSASHLPSRHPGPEARDHGRITRRDDHMTGNV